MNMAFHSGMMEGAGEYTVPAKVGFVFQRASWHPEESDFEHPTSDSKDQT